ncbi:lipopolysaccharide assembly LapA domain-containing protein [Lutibacter sp.]|uniref:LapA family protein n=1 Tax=Lutibacter sp. TaxID=1925666 RepID=UPI003565153A
MKLKTFVAILFATLIVIFSLQNAEVVDVKFLFWKLSFSSVIVILGSFSMGVLVGVLISIKRKITAKKENYGKN